MAQIFCLVYKFKIKKTFLLVTKKYMYIEAQIVLDISVLTLNNLSFKNFIVQGNLFIG